LNLKVKRQLSFSEDQRLVENTAEEPQDLFHNTAEQFEKHLVDFIQFGKPTLIEHYPDRQLDIPIYVNEYWTSKQRAAHSLHEVSYRACFKPQLPAFFIHRLTKKGDIVYDPFMGRGTTALEAALNQRIPYGCDINPLSKILLSPRLSPPDLISLKQTLQEIELNAETEIDRDLLTFYDKDTLKELTNLRAYFIEREKNRTLSALESWIRMVATNRLSGHSPGFFSVYTLPPNQATSIVAQEKINAKRNQKPEYKDIKKLIYKKSKSLLKSCSEHDRRLLKEVKEKSRLITGSSSKTSDIPSSSVKLVVTSPPFLDVVNYKGDNWLRCWFNNIIAEDVCIWQLKKPKDWQERMTEVFCELKRVLVPGGYIAFEVGEVRGGSLLLETLVVPAALNAGLNPLLVMINDQEFTKTANCWGVSNLSKGTNTNRIVFIQK